MITVIGGAGLSVKIMMKPREEQPEIPVMGDTFDYETINVAAKMGDDEDIKISNNGCAFNIAEQLVKAGHQVTLATVVGQDPVGLGTLAQIEQCGISTQAVKQLDGNTPVQVEMLNILGDAQMVFGNSRLYEKITPELIDEWHPIIESAEAVVLDGNLPEETLKYVARKYGNDAGGKIFFDPANHNGAIKSRDIIEQLYCVMPGRTEAEAMIKNSVLSEEELMAAGNTFDTKGISRMIITMKGGGLYYKEGMLEGIMRPERILSFSQTTGAGDTASAAFISATLKGADVETAARTAMDKAAEFLAVNDDIRFIDRIN